MFFKIKKQEVLWILIAIMTLIACQEKKEEKVVPDFSEEKMIAIMKDIHLVEASVQSEKTRVKDSLLTIYYNHIYDIHSITEEDLERNISAWFSDAEATNKLYQKIIESLSIDESKYGKGKKPIEAIEKPKVLEDVNKRQKR